MEFIWKSSIIKEMLCLQKFLFLELSDGRFEVGSELGDDGGWLEFHWGEKHAEKGFEVVSVYSLQHEQSE